MACDLPLPLLPPLPLLMPLQMDRFCLQAGKRCVMWDDEGAGFYLVRAITPTDLKTACPPPTLPTLLHIHPRQCPPPSMFACPAAPQLGLDPQSPCPACQRRGGDAPGVVAQRGAAAAPAAAAAG